MAFDLYNNIAPAITLNMDSYNAGTHNGTVIDLKGYSDAAVILVSGESQAGSTNDVKIQESDAGDGTGMTDVTDGAFTQVTTANDLAVQMKAYRGKKRYIRVVAVVAVAAAEFGVVAVKGNPRHAPATS